jgi:predicted RNA-binding Zn ribbon-like protein
VIQLLVAAARDVFHDHGVDAPLDDIARQAGSALCLELLTTGGPGVLERYEALHEPDDLRRFFGLFRLRVEPRAVRVSPDDLRMAHELRGSLWRLARAAAHKEPLSAIDVDAVNRVAALRPLVPRMDPDGSHSWHAPVEGAQALSTIARDAINLLSGAFADRIRECESPDCFLIFVDTSRPGRRRWCAMEICGNRHKVRALRARRAAGSAGA